MDIKKCIGCEYLIKIDADYVKQKDLWFCQYMAICFNEKSEVECPLVEDIDTFVENDNDKVTNKEIQDISKIFKLDGLVEIDEYCRILDMLPEEEAYKMREIMKDILMYIKDQDTFNHKLMEIVKTIH